MYLSQNIIISLQYNFYQKDANTTLLVRSEEDLWLGTEGYQWDGKRKQMSHFNAGLLNYKDGGELYHKYQEERGIGKLMEA